MDVKAAIQGRRSIRSYSPRDIAEDKLQMVLEAGRLAPSAANMQDWKFIVVKDEATRKRLVVAAGGQQFVGTAPVVLVGCGTVDRIMHCGQYTYPIDVSIALSFMLLEAHELGLGTCWLGHFDENEVKKILNIPPHIRVVAMTPLGYPAENPDPRPRKELSDFVSYETY
ncbi:MAG: nitroreductase family protein [Thermacetogeniaceae bacterium]